MAIDIEKYIQTMKNAVRENPRMKMRGVWRVCIETLGLVYGTPEFKSFNRAFDDMYSEELKRDYYLDEVISKTVINLTGREMRGRPLEDCLEGIPEAKLVAKETFETMVDELSDGLRNTIDNFPIKFDADAKELETELYRICVLCYVKGMKMFPSDLIKIPNISSVSGGRPN